MPEVLEKMRRYDDDCLQEELKAIKKEKRLQKSLKKKQKSSKMRSVKGKEVVRKSDEHSNADRRTSGGDGDKGKKRKNDGKESKAAHDESDDHECGQDDGSAASVLRVMCRNDTLLVTLAN
ncbi:hypothetical protein HDU76_008314 [Blyttiomyces sp. JEL0837]|nr:hypothetical protein HDU76_008314 [Blyttiomyces sp. JEL0837]